MINVGKKMRAISALFVELVGVAGFEPATPSSRTGQRGVRVEAKSLFRFKASVSARTLRKYLIQPNMGHLPGPPRSLAQTEISRFSANRPELAAICARILSLQSADWIAGTVSGPLSLPWKIAFPDGGSWPW